MQVTDESALGMILLMPYGFKRFALLVAGLYLVNKGTSVKVVQLKPPQQ